MPPPKGFKSFQTPPYPYPDPPKPVPVTAGEGIAGKGTGSPGKPQGYPCQSLYIGSIDVLKGPGGLRWVVVTKTGPNDASGVVWAICKNVWFFFFFFDTNLLFNVYIGS